MPTGVQKIPSLVSIMDLSGAFEVGTTETPQRSWSRHEVSLVPPWTGLRLYCFHIAGVGEALPGLHSLNSLEKCDMQFIHLIFF